MSIAKLIILLVCAMFLGSCTTTASLKSKPDEVAKFEQQVAAAGVETLQGVLVDLQAILKETPPRFAHHREKTQALIDIVKAELATRGKEEGPVCYMQHSKDTISLYLPTEDGQIIPTGQVFYRTVEKEICESPKVRAGGK